MLDASSEFGARATRRLHEEKVAWLTTVTPKGTPQPVPVWFLWDGRESILVYSRPGTPKLRNLEHNPRASLHLDGNGKGGHRRLPGRRARLVRSAGGSGARVRHQVHRELRAQQLESRGVRLRLLGADPDHLARHGAPRTREPHPERRSGRSQTTDSRRGKPCPGNAFMERTGIEPVTSGLQS